MAQLKGFRFVTTIVLVFKKIERKDKTKYDNFCSSLKAGIIIDESDIDDVLKSIYTTIIENIQKYLAKGSRLIIDSVIDHTTSISKYNALAGSSYIKLPKGLDHPRKGLINIQNGDDNECFKWCLVRYLNPADYHPARVAKADKDLSKTLYFKDIIFPVKIRDILKIENKNSTGISVFANENKEKYPTYVSGKRCEEKHGDLLLIGEVEKKALCSYQRF